MRMCIRKIYPIVILLFLICQKSESKTKRIDTLGYKNCIQITNANCKVILDPNVGGRVLVYSIENKNVLYINPANNGVLYEPGEKMFEVSAGRFDVGFGFKNRELLTHGTWKAEILDDFSARLISQKNTINGFQLIREFRLDSSSTHLACTQLIKNISDTVVIAGHWGRTFVEGGGIAITPLNPKSRYEKGYITNGLNKMLIQYHDSSDNIRIGNNMLEILGEVPYHKFFFDSHEGWLAYISLSNLLYVNTFDVCKTCAYGDVVSSTSSFWYNKTRVCEVEPMGPLGFIEPGQSYSFTENWWLFPYKYPKDKTTNLNEIRSIVNHCKQKE